MAGNGPNRLRRLSVPEAAVIALLVFAVFRVVNPIWTLAVSSPRLPQWDMAKYGVSGLRLTRALQDLDVLAFFRQLNALEIWPPVFPLLEVPAFLFAGSGYASARGLVALMFATAIVVAFWCGAQSDTRWGIAVGSFSATLLAISPMAHLLATVVMLEIPGTLLLLLAMAFYLRSLRSDQARAFSVACVASTALFFCKFNYGLIWILPMAVNELRRSGMISPTMLSRLGAALRRPWPAILTAGLVMAAIIEIAGPWRFNLGAREISVSSAGPLLYGLYAALLISRILRPRRSFEEGKRWLGSLDARARTMMLAIALPIGLWMVVPSHAINFVRFLINRSAGPSILSFESLLFYPRVFVDEYAPAPAVAVVVLVLAAFSLRRLRASDEVGRVLALAVVVSTIAAVAHPYKQPRFLFTTAVLLWIAGSREGMEWVARVSASAGETTQRRIAAVVSGAGLAVAAFVAVDIDRLDDGHRRLTVHAATAEVLEIVCGQAEQAQSSVLLGTWNHFSPWLVEWGCLQRRPPMEPTRVPRSPSGRRHRIDAVDQLLHSQPELVMVVSPAPGTSPRAGFVKETRWLEPVRVRLAHDPRFHLVARRDFADAGYRLETFEAGRADGEPVPR